MRKFIELSTGKGIARTIAISLRRRNLTLERVCQMAKIGRAHFSQVLHGKRSCTQITWDRIEPFLSYEERQVLRGTNVSYGTPRGPAGNE